MESDWEVVIFFEQEQLAKSDRQDKNDLVSHGVVYDKIEHLLSIKKAIIFNYASKTGNICS